LRREENQKTQRKTLEARERINNKLNSHMTLSPGIKPEITVVSALPLQISMQL
jgi:hypothetical protein